MSKLSRRKFLRSSAAAGLLLYTPSIVRAQSTTKLSASYSTRAFDEIMASEASIYKTQSGATVTYAEPVAANHDEHLLQILRWRFTNELPEVSFQANYHIRQLIREGLAQPLQALADADSTWRDVQPRGAVAQVGRMEGKLYGIPFQISVPVVMINEALATKAGADISNLPSDWASLINLAKKITTASNGAVGGFFDFGAAWTFQALITAQGGKMSNSGETAVGFDGADGLAALEIIRGFGEAGMVDMSQSQALQAFGAGTIGVLATSNNVLAGLEKQAGGRFKIATVPWPMPSPQGKLPAGGRTGVVFTSVASQKQAAWAFLRFLASPAAQAIVVKATGAVPVDPTAMKASGLLDAFYAEHPNYLAGLARADQLTEWYNYPGKNTVKITNVMIDHLKSVATLNATPEQALKSMTLNVNALMKSV